MRRYLLIGSGAAGFAAAEAIRSRDSHGEILMVSEDRFGYYSRPGLAYYLTGELNQDILFPVQKNFFNELNVRLQPGKVSRLALSAHLVYLDSGQTIPYDRVLLATGAQATPLKLPGCELEGVVKLDCLFDAQQIVKLARRARTAVVVGGGITALELVEGLVARRVKVHYFLRGDRYWNNVLDETESRLVEQRLVNHGVRIHYRTELESIVGKNGRVAAVKTRQGEIVGCEILGYAIGIRPRLELAQASGLACERGILVDEYLQTNAADVFAAGDVAQVFDPFSGQSILDSLWNPARQQGSQAGMNMAGASEPYNKGVPFNVTRLAGLTTTIIGMVNGSRSDEQTTDPDLLGIARGDSETWRQLPDAIAAQTGFEINNLRILVGKKQLMGALVMGDQTLSLPLQRMINAQADISPIRERLLSPGACLADILVDFYNHWRRENVPVQ